MLAETVDNLEKLEQTNKGKKTLYTIVKIVIAQPMMLGLVLNVVRAVGNQGLHPFTNVLQDMVLLNLKIFNWVKKPQTPLNICLKMTFLNKIIV